MLKNNIDFLMICIVPVLFFRNPVVEWPTKGTILESINLKGSWPKKEEKGQRIYHSKSPTIKEERYSYQKKKEERYFNKFHYRATTVSSICGQFGGF